MKVLNYTRPAVSWQPKCATGRRDEVLDEILKQLCSGAFFEVNHELTHESVLQALIDREGQRTTAIGNGIAFPHARLEGLAQALFAVATFDEPVFFEEFPVQIICLILVPIVEPTVSLKIMAQLSRMLSEPTIVQQVLAAQDPQTLCTLFKQHDLRIDKPILARDIMRPPRFAVREDVPVSRCSHMMSVNGLQAVPVINERHEVMGEVTVERLFRYGLPEFFSKLKSVSFIAEFDPFEKYFADERNVPVGEMMEKTARIVPMDYTIMEIVFDLAIQPCSMLYVADNTDRLVGTIDKSTVLDNVINH